MFERSRAASRSLLLSGLVGTIGWVCPSSACDQCFVRFTWVRLEGTEDCPSETEVMGKLRERLGRNPFLADAQRRLEAEVSRDGNHWRVRVRELDQRGQVVGAREIDANAADCAPIADMAMLTLALAIDPDAGLPPDVMASGSSSPSQPPAQPQSPPAAPVPSPSVMLPAACPAPDRADRSEGEFSVHGLAAVGLLPGLAPGIGLTAQASLIAQWRAELGMAWFWEQEANDVAKFGLTFVRAGLCRSLHQVELARWDACSQLQAGALHSVVSGLEAVNPGDTIWWAWSGGSRLRVGRRAMLEAAAYAVVPLLRPRFVVGGRPGSVFRPSAVSGIFSVGVGVSIP